MAIGMNAGKRDGSEQKKTEAEKVLPPLGKKQLTTVPGSDIFTKLKTKQERMASVLTLSQMRAQRSISVLLSRGGKRLLCADAVMCIRIFYGGVIP